MAEEDYDSSDLEFDAPTNPFFSAGLASIEAIIDFSAEDRIRSKKLTKTLEFSEASPKTEYLTALWYNRFVAFRLHSLKKSAIDVPNGADIERFLDAIMSKIRPAGDVPSLSWIKVGLRRVLMSLTFHYSTFTLSNHERLRLKTIFHQFLKEGRITRKPIRDVQWVGSLLLRRLVVALLREAYDEGTTNWDKTIQKTLSLLLIGALSCRSGDIMKDQRDTHPLPFLCYDDITIKLVGGNEIENLEAIFVIRNEKKKKNNPRDNRNVLLRAISEQHQNVMCPIKMLLISAMRLGAVKGTIEQILAGVASRRDKTLQWIKGRGSSPVLCAFETAAHHVVIDKPAMTDQIRFTTYNASLKAGFLASVIPHDIRRGAARDTAHLHIDPTAATGLASASVAAELGQSARSLELGITAAYVGTRHDDTWTRRVNTGFLDTFGLDVTNNVYQRPRWTNVEFNRIYQIEGVDPSDHKAKRRARESKHKEHERQWRICEKNVESGRQPLSDSPGNCESRPALLPLTASRTNVVATRKRKAEPKALNDTDAEMGIETYSGDRLYVPDFEDIEDHIDPRLLCSADHVSHVIADVDSAAVMNNKIEEIVLGLGAPLEIPSALVIPGFAFVNLLSRINVISNKRLASSKTKEIPESFRGNGRDEPTLFQHKCRRTPGCSYSSDNTYSLLIHEARCSVERLEKINAIDKPHKCLVCSASFEKNSDLKYHRDNLHNYKPRACTSKDCDPTILYASRGAFRKHQTEAHPSWTPTNCPINGCTHRTSFKTAQALKAHIQVVHKIDDKELLKRYTYVRTLSYFAQSCSYPECVHAKVFKEKRALVAHLEKVHEVAKNDVTIYIILE